MVVEAASELVAVIGHVGGEIGVRAVGLHQRPIHVVAELSGAEQELLAVFPFLVDLALRRRQASCVDQPLRLQVGDRVGDLVVAVRQRALGEEDVMADAERGEVVLDQVQHLV